MEDAHKSLKIRKLECPDIWIRLPRHKWPNSWSSMEDLVVPLERNLYRHLFAGKHQKLSQEEFYLLSMFNDISCDGKGNEEECLANARVVKVLARKFGVGEWSFIGPGSEKKWYSAENSPQGAWDHIAEDMLLEFAESGHPTFRATTPLSRSIRKSKGHGKLSIHFTAYELTIETIFRIIISVNQLRIYAAVAAFFVKNLRIIKMDQGNLRF